MSVTNAIRAILIADGGVSAKVGTRVYPLVAPANAALPFVTYQWVAAARRHGLGGSVQLATPTIQVDSYAATYTSVHELVTAVRQALDGYSGTIAGAEIQEIQAGNELDIYDNESDDGLYRVTQDYSVTFTEV